MKRELKKLTLNKQEISNLSLKIRGGLRKRNDTTNTYTTGPTGPTAMTLCVVC